MPVIEANLELVSNLQLLSRNLADLAIDDYRRTQQDAAKEVRASSSDITETQLSVSGRTGLWWKEECALQDQGATQINDLVGRWHLAAEISPFELVAQDRLVGAKDRKISSNRYRAAGKKRRLSRIDDRLDLEILASVEAHVTIQVSIGKSSGVRQELVSIHNASSAWAIGQLGAVTGSAISKELVKSDASDLVQALIKDQVLLPAKIVHHSFALEHLDSDPAT